MMPNLADTTKEASAKAVMPRRKLLSLSFPGAMLGKAPGKARCVIIAEISEGARKNVRENKTVTVDPVGVLGIEGHELVKENMSYRCHAHRRTGVARVGRERGIDLYRGRWSVIGSAEDEGNRRRVHGRVERKTAIAGQACRHGGVIGKGRRRTARVRMVLMASSSVLS